MADLFLRSGADRHCHCRRHLVHAAGHAAIGRIAGGVRAPNVDLPEKQSHEDFKAFVFKQVFCNKYIWLLSAANFFVYVIRYAVFDWATTLLSEAKHIEIENSKWMLVGFLKYSAFLARCLAVGFLTAFALGPHRACVGEFT